MDFSICWNTFYCSVSRIERRYDIYMPLRIFWRALPFVAAVAVLAYPFYKHIPIGLVLVAVGNVLFGLTDGFSDSTPRGRLLFRIGATSYIVGIPIIAYFLYPMLR